MAPKERKLAEGQIWKRLNSDREIEITGLKNGGTEENPFYDIKWKGRNFTGRGETFQDSFYRRHEYVGKVKK